MSDYLSGQAMFVDHGASILLCGRMTLHSDGEGRSEIVLRSPDGSEEQRLVFSARSTWVPVFQLIQVIREAFGASSQATASVVANSCNTCSGQGGGFDEDGNWLDCPTCN